MYFGGQKLYYLLREYYPKLKFDKNEIDTWLSNQEIYQLNKRLSSLNLTKAPKEIKVPRNLKISADLIDLTGQPDGKFNYILTVVENYSRYVWMFPIRKKTPQNIALFLNPLLNKYKQINILLTDNGTEFNIDNIINTDQKIIHLYSRSGVPTDNALTERMNGNIQKLLRMYRTASGNNRWASQLETFQDNINNSINSSIRDTPKNAFESLLKQQKNIRKNEVRLENGTQVRIVNVKKIKDGKISTEKYRWSEDIYSVVKSSSSPKGYKYTLVDSNGDKIKGTYTINYLQVITDVQQPPNKIVEERVIGKRNNAEVDSLNEFTEQNLGKRRKT